ncbi:MAG TPA: hypothetical protein DCR93_32910 [Cytophagales bacterium]|nr:hypothetical protein [Cytophagales bacterium]
MSTLFSHPIGDYEAFDILGMGGQGVVYKAKHLRTDRVVAIKTLKVLPFQNQDTHRQQLQRFERETQMCVRLSHPHIVQLVDKGISSTGDPYAVFEYVEGYTLRNLLLKEGALSGALVGRLLGQVLDALACAHSQGIIHRDLKPSNLMVTETGAAPQIKILDFGIGAVLEPYQTAAYASVTQNGESVGTPRYSAPEQLNGGVAYPSSDLYALGLVILECLTGIAPVREFSQWRRGYLDPVVHAHLVIPHELENHPLGHILERMLEDDVSQRFSSAHEVAWVWSSVDFSALPTEHTEAEGMETTEVLSLPYHQSGVAPTSSKQPNGWRLTHLLFPLLVVLIIALKGATPAENSSMFHWSDSSSLFPEIDTNAFHILITRFEDMSNPGEYNCIGHSIQDQLGVIASNNQLPLELKIHYVDSIMSPHTLQEAKRIQTRHCADLVLYGLATNAEPNCGVADLCFRWSISPTVIDPVSELIEVRAARHRAASRKISGLDIQRGVLSVDDVSFEAWITALVFAKVGQRDSSLVALDVIANDVLKPKAVRTERYYTMAKTFWELGEWEVVWQIAKDWVLLEESDAEGWYYLSQSLVRLGRFQAALDAANKVVQLRPDWAKGYFARGWAYGENYMDQEAIFDYTKAISLDSTLVELYNDRGLYHLRQGRIEEALADLNKAYQIDPTFPQVYLGRGVLAAVGNDHLNAVENYSHSIDRNPKIRYSYAFRAISYAWLGEFEKAELDIVLANGTDPGSYWNQLAKGWLSSRKGDQAAAVQIFNQVIDQNPGVPHLWFYRALHYYKSDQFRQAIADFGKTLEISPEYAQVLALLGECRLKASGIRSMLEGGVYEAYPEGRAADPGK